MGLISKWTMPDGRDIVDNWCDARFIELSQSPRAILTLAACLTAKPYTVRVENRLPSGNVRVVSLPVPETELAFVPIYGLSHSLR